MKEDRRKKTTGDYYMEKAAAPTCILADLPLHAHERHQLCVLKQPMSPDISSPWKDNCREVHMELHAWLDPIHHTSSAMRGQALTLPTSTTVSKAP